VHITLSHETKRHILSNFAAYSDEQVIIECSKGRDGKINGDNLDIYVRTNDIRMDNKNRDYHFFASDFTFDRIPLLNMDDTKPLGDVNNIEYTCFLPSLAENKLYKDSLRILIARILIEHIDGFQWMKPVVPQHISHEFEDIKKSKLLF